MKLFRFMSSSEFNKYINGDKLINNNDHKFYKTASTGFCFFNYAEYNPEEMLHSVTGIVSMDICCIFEVSRNFVKKSYGRYSKAKYKDSFKREIVVAKEYCTTEYSKENFKLLKYAIPDWFNWEKWDWKEL